ncbi:MAG: Translation initiation factor 1A [Paramarteilia canceri]
MDGAVYRGRIRGHLNKKRNKQYIRPGDTVLISMRADFSENDVDIVHRYNEDDIHQLLQQKELTQAFTTANVSSFDAKEEFNKDEEQFLEFGEDSESSDDEDENEDLKIGKKNYNDIDEIIAEAKEDSEETSSEEEQIDYAAIFAANAIQNGD